MFYSETVCSNIFDAVEQFVKHVAETQSQF